MKTTGIVRRIDDLGRVVIPREIRKKFGIREGDPLEIFADGNIIGLKKYRILDEWKDTIAKTVLRVFKSNNIVAAIYDNDYTRITGTKEFEQYCGAFQTHLGERTPFTVDYNKHIYSYPILSQGELIGYIIYKGDESISIIRAMAQMIGYNCED